MFVVLVVWLVFVICHNLDLHVLLLLLFKYKFYKGVESKQHG